MLKILALLRQAMPATLSFLGNPKTDFEVAGDEVLPTTRGTSRQLTIYLDLCQDRNSAKRAHELPTLFAQLVAV